MIVYQTSLIRDGATPTMPIVHQFGTFSDDPTLQWLTDSKLDRLMKLANDFSFTDSTGKIWTARKSLNVDGASIPRALWTLVGSPYTGNYRRASIVHDQYCVDHPKDGPERKAADMMFKRACQAGGCGKFEAVKLYIGVRIGSSWSGIRAQKGFDQPRIEDDEVRTEFTDEERAIQNEFRQMVHEFEALANAKNLASPDDSLADIELADIELADTILKAHGYPA